MCVSGEMVWANDWELLNFPCKIVSFVLRTVFALVNTPSAQAMCKYNFDIRLSASRSRFINIGKYIYYRLFVLNRSAVAGFFN